MASNLKWLCLALVLDCRATPANKPATLSIFDRTFSPADGLGPLYVADRCSACHAGAQSTRVTKFAQVDSDGHTPTPGQPLAPYGNTVRAQLAAGAKTRVFPPEVLSVVVTQRLSPSLAGRGAIDAVSDAAILAAEAAQAGSALAGHANRLADTSIGRYGLKAREPSAREFIADALQLDMGLTTSLRPNELANPDRIIDDDRAGVDLDDGTLQAFVDEVLARNAPPERGSAVGRALFAAVGCASCHVPSLRTRDGGQGVFIYSDLLLHDLGDSLADGIVEGSAGSRDWRTTPLIDLAASLRFLHDGRANSIAEAIAWHASNGSQANSVVDAFNELSGDDRAVLQEFVLSL